MNVMLSVSHLAKRFDNGVQALADLTFALNEGDFVSLLGPSGCGKSTALRLIAGLLTQDGGAIAWNGPRPELGFVFQDPTLMPWADALTNARLALDLKGRPRGQANAIAAAALHQVGLGGFERAYPRELSGGMKMRVSAARALAAGAKLLLLDEPFGALDEITRHQLGDDLLTLWRQTGLTILFVTHSVAESCALSERVLVMSPRPGRLAADIALPPQSGRPGNFRLSPQFLDCQAQVSAALTGVKA